MEIKMMVTLNKVITNKEDRLTFKDLYESILDEIKTYEKLGIVDELMDQEVVVNVYDSEGKVLNANINSLIGWLESGKVMLTGNLDDIYE